MEDPRVIAALKKAGIGRDSVATHSLRKAAATFAAGGTAGTPMHFTILIRGGWSIGKVLSTYFQLADDGDRQLANLLAGRQYLTKDFSRLVPHFTTNVTTEVIKSVFVGEYVKAIDLDQHAMGIYFLEIETNNGVINKKLILQ